jgi:hypothetical protein
MSDRLIFNRGKRPFVLKSGPKGEKRVLMPGQTIRPLDEKEAKMLLSYERECIEAGAVSDKNDRQIKELEATIEKLKADNAKLKATAKEEPTPTESDAEDAREVDAEPAPARSGKGSKRGR